MDISVFAFNLTRAIAMDVYILTYFQNLDLLQVSKHDALSCFASHSFAHRRRVGILTSTAHVLASQGSLKAQKSSADSGVDDLDGALSLYSDATTAATDQVRWAGLAFSCEGSRAH